MLMTRPRISSGAISCASETSVDVRMIDAHGREEQQRIGEPQRSRQREQQHQQAERGLHHQRVAAHVGVLAAPGDDQRAGHRAGAGHRHHPAVAIDALPEHLAHDHRQQRLHRQSQERREEAERRQRDERRARLHVGEAGAHLFEDRPVRGLERMVEFQREQRRDHEQERQAVQREAGGHAEGGERHAGDQRAEDARQVELNRVERDGVRQVAARHERRKQRLIRRSAERLRDAGRERQREHVPDAHDVEVDERGQDERAGQLDGLGADQQVAAIVAVGDHAADQRQQQDRQFADEAVESEVEGRAADGQHQPVLRDLLHPGAGRRQDVGASTAAGSFSTPAPSRGAPGRAAAADRFFGRRARPGPWAAAVARRRGGCAGGLAGLASGRRTRIGDGAAAGVGSETDDEGDEGAVTESRLRAVGVMAASRRRPGVAAPQKTIPYGSTAVVE